jgi:hypothetical protein
MVAEVIFAGILKQFKLVIQTHIEVLSENKQTKLAKTQTNDKI